MKLYYICLVVAFFSPTVCVFEDIRQSIATNDYISNCTLFGFHIASQLKARIKSLDKKISKLAYNSEKRESFLCEKYIAEDCLSTILHHIYLNDKYDEIEKQKECKKTIIFGKSSTAQIYISEFVWAMRIQDLKKSLDKDFHIKEERDIEAINPYYASSILDSITKERVDLHARESMNQLVKKCSQ